MCKWMRPFWGRDCQRAPKTLSSAQAAPSAAPALRELDSAVTVPTVCFSGWLRGSPEGVSSSLRPKPSSPFARYSNVLVLFKAHFGKEILILFFVFSFVFAKPALKSPKPALKWAKPALKRPNRHKKKYIKKIKTGPEAPKPALNRGLGELCL